MAAVQQWFFGITLLRRGECDESHSLHFPSAAPRLEKLTTLALLCFSTSLKIDGLPSFILPIQMLTNNVKEVQATQPLTF